MSLKKLIIVGAGNFGREVLAWSKDIPESQREWEVKGFIDDYNSVIGRGFEVPIVGTITDYNPHEDDVFLCAIADPKGKLSVCEELEKRGATFINFIHPTAVLGLHNKIGRGLIMCPFSTISSNVSVGNFVTINGYSSIGHDAVIEDGVTLSGHCDVTGYVQLGKGVFLGSGARLLPKACAEEFAVIGAGSVVLKKVRAHKTVFGVPAKYIK